jgi:hypothetical protein
MQTMQAVNEQVSYMKVPKLVYSLHVGPAFLMIPLNVNLAISNL